MKCNIGWVERTVRVLIGLPIVTATLYVRHFSIGWSYFCMGLGGWLLLTAALRWCPVSTVLGRDTSQSSLQSPS